MSLLATPLRRLLAFAALGLALQACPGPNPVDPPDASVDAGCEGALGCACEQGTCTSGECVAGVCTDCRRGEEACICRANGTCNEGLRCEGSLCATCPAGQEGCACGAGDTCEAGLACSNGTCVQDSCTPGSTGCPCRPGEPACDEGQYCDGTSRCQTCSADVVGCACGPSGTCMGGLQCEATTQKCRLALTCQQLLASGECKEHQVCNEAPGTDAVCVADTCVEGHKWDSVTESCLPCVSEGCTAEPTCDAGGELALSCAQQHRVCTQAGASASCGACLQGYTEGTGGACVPAPTCGTTTCGSNEYCETREGAPFCKALPCAPGVAVDPFTGKCAPTACTLPCSSEGFSGRPWPFLTKSGTCVCETLDGYFLPSGGTGLAEECDADGDGWVRKEAEDNQVRNDFAFKANARCAVRWVDRVRLVDEYGLSAEVVSCATGLLKAPDAAACGSVLALPLLETKRNDVPGAPQPGTGAPLYGGTSGRQLEARELNALTKACVSTTADFNNDGQTDIREVQASGTSSDDRARLAAFSYFVELHSAHYEAPAAGKAYGTLVLAERSRCAADFPLRYDGQSAYVRDDGATYWRNCSRARDPDYDRAESRPGFDFAQWTCADATGSCTLAPPAHATETAPTNPDEKLLRNYGLCELNGSVPADLQWRGMHHHSQFKCVSVETTRTESFMRLQGEFGAGPDLLTFNGCAALPCGEGEACAVSPGSGAQTQQPVIRCQVQPTPGLSAVGFAAVNFRPYPSTERAGYGGGCINEDAAYAIGARGTYVCPYPEYSTHPERLASSFGRSSCYGDLQNYLWSGPPASAVRSTLRWGQGASDTAMGVWR